MTLKSSPWVVITVEGVLATVVDLTDAEVQRQLQTSLAELTGDWAYTQATAGIAPTQVLGQAAFDCGILGFEYKSAKNLSGGNSVVIFADHLATSNPSYLEVFDEHRNLTQRLP